MAHQKFKNRNLQKVTLESHEDADITMKRFGYSRLQAVLLMSLALFTVKASTTYNAVYNNRNKFQKACFTFSNKIQRARSWLLEESERLKKESKTS